MIQLAAIQNILGSDSNNGPDAECSEVLQFCELSVSIEREGLIIIATLVHKPVFRDDEEAAYLVLVYRVVDLQVLQLWERTAHGCKESLLQAAKKPNL